MIKQIILNAPLTSSHSRKRSHNNIIAWYFELTVCASLCVYCQNSNILRRLLFMPLRLCWCKVPRNPNTMGLPIQVWQAQIGGLPIQVWQAQIWGLPIQVWQVQIGGFPPKKQASPSSNFDFHGSHGRTVFGGSPPMMVWNNLPRAMHSTDC